MTRQQTPQMALPFRLQEKASLDNFYPHGNEQLVQAIRDFIAATEFRCLYFYGELGSGKSHLLFSAIREAQELGLSSMYVRLNDQLPSESLLSGVSENTLVCIDDINFWRSNQEREEALFSVFERVKQLNGRLFVAANNPPAECGFALKDLVSRLSSGLIYPLKALADDRQLAALKLRAKQRGLSISDETVKYLTTRLPRGNAELFSTLDQIDKASLVEKRRITIPFLRQSLGI